jgi:hypothetical protein
MSSFTTWLAAREKNKAYIRQVMSNYFPSCQGDIKKITNLVAKDYGVVIMNGNSYAGFIEDLIIELSTQQTFAKLEAN